MFYHLNLLFLFVITLLYYQTVGIFRFIFVSFTFLVKVFEIAFASTAHRREKKTLLTFDGGEMVQMTGKLDHRKNQLICQGEGV